MKRIVRRISIVLLIILSSCSKHNEDNSTATVHPMITFAAFGNTGLVTDDGAVFRKLAGALQNHNDIDFAVELGNKLPVGVPPSGVDGLLEAVDKDMKTVPVPVYPVVGPHDVFDYLSDVAYSSHYGPLWYAFERGGVHFFVLDTDDESYRSGFGVFPNIGEEQLTWLMENMVNKRDEQSVVVFMNRPLWQDAPKLWSEQLFPAFKAGDVDLMVTCSEKGLYDWGMIDGIRAVSTGCNGPVHATGTGLFPHILLITMDSEKSSFGILHPDGETTEGIDNNQEKQNMVDNLVTSLRPGVLKTGISWNISESADYKLSNPFKTVISGSLSFMTFKNTTWKIDPLSFKFSLTPGETSTFHVSIRGKEPDLSPVPTYHLTMQVGDTVVADCTGMLLREIPRQRTGETVPISAHIADMVPYSFDKKILRLPVEVEGPDLCGRLIIYRENMPEIPVCIYLSPLRDFRDGLNEFTWNGTDLEGHAVTVDSLTYYIVVYNKAAPPTWVAEGPPSYYGTLTVERSINGLIAKTHTDDSLVQYRIPGLLVAPKPELTQTLAGILEGLPITGYAFDDRERIFVTTPVGILCAFLSGGVVRPDMSFGERGYAQFSQYRGRAIGNPSFNRGMVYVGIGGGNGKSPSVLAINGENGETVKIIPLGEYFGEEINPPALTASDRGIYAGHPVGGYVLFMNNSGELLWLNEPGDLGGDSDADGHSFTYGIGFDRYGFSYVNTPGTSARCAVLGPDGRSLFRVILVILPGLRVSSVVPMIEGKSTDGLYFVTRGADKPYVFHVPYTIKTGKIIEERLIMKK